VNGLGTKKLSKDGIYGFFEPYRWLSNFHLADVTLDGEVYRSNEHAYMAAKTLDPAVRKIILSLPTCREAKQYGRKVKLRSGWDEIKYGYMLDINRQKYKKHAYLARLLLDTGDQYLEETNTWDDTYWGVCNDFGQNNLGKILMQVRDEIKGSLA